jgi:hypothetical protein
MQRTPGHQITLHLSNFRNKNSIETEASEIKKECACTQDVEPRRKPAPCRSIPRRERCSPGVQTTSAWVHGTNLAHRCPDGEGEGAYDEPEVKEKDKCVIWVTASNKPTSTTF